MFAAICVSVAVAGSARADWLDRQWAFRRPIEVNWDTEHPTGSDLATAGFYADGHLTGDGKDVRVATEDGQLVASHVLMAGPGDFVRVVFALQAPVQKYYVYFGNPSPTPPPDGKDDVQYHEGLLMEMHRLEGSVENFHQMEESWANRGRLIGAKIVDNPFIGGNPFGDEINTITRFTGSLFVPTDGGYDFAGGCENKGALYIDGKRLLFMPWCPGDVRFHKHIDLKRGPHDFLLYQADTGGELRVSIAWRSPDNGAYQVIGRESFGVAAHGVVGPLEQLDKTLTADFSPTYLGECFVNGAYTHRYRLAAASRGDIKVEWDFGDGQTAAGATVTHVFLTRGVYPVRVTFRLGGNSDTQTLLLPVDRDWPNLTDPATDDPPVQSRIVAKYDVSAMPIKWLGPAAMLHLKAGDYSAMLPPAERLAEQATHADPTAALDVLQSISDSLIFIDKSDEAIDVWDHAPGDSDLQPRAARAEAQLCLWWSANFDKAVSLLRPFADQGDEATRRVLGEALVLDGKADDGTKMLQALPATWPPEKLAAMSGAMARTIESFINDRDCETGERDWEKWTAHAPATFLQGYSVVLRTKLMELRHDNAAAAKVCEAFAAAVPDSSYAPTLLDRASKLLAATDPQKSAELRQTLKTRYPEDPLSNVGADGAADSSGGATGGTGSK